MNAAKSFKDYRIVRLLDSGANSKTYVLNKDNKQFVLKFTRIVTLDVAQDKEQWYKTKQVLTTLSSIKHPNIVEVYEVGEVDITDSNYQRFLDMINWNEVKSEPEPYYNQHDSSSGIPYVIMQYIEGHDMIKQHTNSEQALELITDLMSALSVFAKYNIRHGDMKFQNVIYNTKTGRYVVIDFDFSEITMHLNIELT